MYGIANANAHEQLDAEKIDIEYTVFFIDELVERQEQNRININCN